MKKGFAASPGIGIGKAYLLVEPEICINSEPIPETKIEKECEKLNEAIGTSKDQLEEIYKISLANLGHHNAEIIHAHLAMLEDPYFLDAVREKIRNQKYRAEFAVAQSVDEQAKLFEAIEDPYIKERAADIKDVGMRLLRNILGIPVKDLSRLHEDVILIGKDITPSQMAVIDRAHVKGIVSETGGATSHTVILARSMDIPAVTGAEGIASLIREGQLLAVDGSKGIVEADLDMEKVEELKARIERQQDIIKHLKQYSNRTTATTDGKQVELCGNIGKPEDALKALESGAEGIGLFRTEFLYMDRKSMPDEEEQFEAYKQAAVSMKGRPVIIRTLDIGGDKQLDYMDLPREENPFLGWRAIRICLEKTDIFKMQLRAVLRASAFGNIQIMYPMIASVDEVRQANGILEEVKQELLEKGQAFDEDIRVGIMVEIPSAAVTADIIAREVDFMSIGTNDLTQYTLAVDRMNGKVSAIYNSFSPAVLRLIRQVIDACHKAGKPVGMCGELAGNPLASVLLLGMGLDEFSMSSSAILKVRKIICSVDTAFARKTADEVMMLESAEQIEAYLRQVMRTKQLDYILEV